MEEINAKLIDLTNKLDALKKNFAQNNANITKLFAYSVNKLNYVEGHLEQLKIDRDELKNDSRKISKSIDEIEKEIENIKKSVEVVKNESLNNTKQLIESETKDIKKRLENLENKCKPAKNYIIIDATDSAWICFSKVRKFLYLLFNFRKVLNQVNVDQKVLEEAIRIDIQNKKLEEIVKAEQEKAAKQKARNEIKNILMKG